MRKLKQTVKDYKFYLDRIEELGLELSKENQEVLENVLSVQLAMLIAFKRDSNLGVTTYSKLT